MGPKAVADRIVCEVLPREDMEGLIHLPENRKTYIRSRGEVLEGRVVSVGPECHDAEEGMVLLIDPWYVDEEACAFTWKGKDYVSVPEVYWRQRTGKGALMGVHRVVSDR